MLGASIVMPRFYSAKDVTPALQAIQRSVELTPYDPAMYNLRAMTRLVAEERLAGVLMDLEKSLKLDATNSRALDILDSISMVINRAGPYERLSRNLHIDSRDKAVVELMQQRFPKKLPEHP